MKNFWEIIIKKRIKIHDINIYIKLSFSLFLNCNTKNFFRIKITEKTEIKNGIINSQVIIFISISSFNSIIYLRKKQIRVDIRIANNKAGKILLTFFK